MPVGLTLGSQDTAALGPSTVLLTALVASCRSSTSREHG